MNNAPKTRDEIADELLVGCPDELLNDHTEIADMIRRGDSWEKILDNTIVNQYPDTYVWISTESNYSK